MIPEQSKTLKSYPELINGTYKRSDISVRGSEAAVTVVCVSAPWKRRREVEAFNPFSSAKLIISGQPLTEEAAAEGLTCANTFLLFYLLCRGS